MNAVGGPTLRTLEIRRIDPLPWAVYGALVGLAVGGAIALGLAAMAASPRMPPPPAGAQPLEWPIAVLVGTILFGASSAGGAMSYNLAARLVRGLQIDVELRDGEDGLTRASLLSVGTRRAARTLILGSLVFGLGFGLLWSAVTMAFAKTAEAWQDFPSMGVVVSMFVGLALAQAIALGWLGAWTYNRWCRRNEPVWLGVRSLGGAVAEIRQIPARPLARVALQIGATGGPALALMVVPLQAVLLLFVAPPADLPPPMILLGFMVFAVGFGALSLAIVLGFELMAAAAIASRIYNLAVRWLPAVQVEVVDDDPR